MVLAQGSIVHTYFCFSECLSSFLKGKEKYNLWVHKKGMWIFRLYFRRFMGISSQAQYSPNSKKNWFCHLWELQIGHHVKLNFGLGFFESHRHYEVKTLLGRMVPLLLKSLSVCCLASDFLLNFYYHVSFKCGS